MTALKKTTAYIALLLLAAAMAGCGGKEEETTVAEVETTAATTEAPTTTAAPVISIESETDEETTEAETETEPVTEEETTVPDIPPEEGFARSPVTNMWIREELVNRRPIAVMYPTDKKAQPQYGLDRVSVFYEIMEEGDMSRQMGILEDWEDLERIGNIRSTRDYFVMESMEWDSILVHYGGPEVFVKDILTRDDVDNINGVGGVMGDDYGAFYRVPAGTNSMHAAYTDGAHVKRAIEKGGFETLHREGLWDPNRWKFARETEQVDLSSYGNSGEAADIYMAGCFPTTKSEFHYNAEDGLYYRSIYGSPQKDAVTGEQMAFKNILIESCFSGSRGAGYIYYHVLDGGHDGYYITNGRMIHCKWVKTNEYETTRFFDDDGNEITLNTGKTMVCICREGDSFKIGDTQITL